MHNKTYMPKYNARDPFAGDTVHIIYNNDCQRCVSRRLLTPPPPPYIIYSVCIIIYHIIVTAAVMFHIKLLRKISVRRNRFSKGVLYSYIIYCRPLYYIYITLLGTDHYKYYNICV